MSWMLAEKHEVRAAVKHVEHQRLFSLSALMNNQMEVNDCTIQLRFRALPQLGFAFWCSTLELCFMFYVLFHSGFALKESSLLALSPTHYLMSSLWTASPRLAVFSAPALLLCFNPGLLQCVKCYVMLCEGFVGRLFAPGVQTRTPQWFCSYYFALCALCFKVLMNWLCLPLVDSFLSQKSYSKSRV